MNDLARIFRLRLRFRGYRYHYFMLECIRRRDEMPPTPEGMSDAEHFATWVLSDKMQFNVKSALRSVIYYVPKPRKTTINGRFYRFFNSTGSIEAEKDSARGLPQGVTGHKSDHIIETKLPFRQRIGILLTGNIRITTRRITVERPQVITSIMHIKSILK